MSPWMRLALAAGMLAATMAVAGCAEGGEEPTPSPEAIPNGASEDTGPLFGRIQADSYPNWRVAPGYQTPQPAEGPHGEQVQIFLNEPAATAREEAASSWPDGSIIVKDVFVDHSIDLIAAMEKRDGVWHWGEWTPEGQPTADGAEVEPCEGCHKSGTDGTLGVRIGR